MLEPELSHHLSLGSMRTLRNLGLSGLYREKVSAQEPSQHMGLTFPNKVGLAAGLDKNADYIDALGDIGFGFVEVGTITPRPQPGNPKPRLFRLPEHEAIINRMGFNNKGVDHLVRQVDARKYSGVLGINIGKNLDTAVEEAEKDYLTCLEKVYAYADYITVNLSSPNTPGLRKLQMGEALSSLVNVLAEKKSQLSSIHGKNVPLLIKIAPDMEAEELLSVAETAISCELDGLIATNTTVDRDRVSGLHADEAGGLSGKPVKDKSTLALQHLSDAVQGKLCLVGVGGIFSAKDAQEKFAAGADLIQIYSGFIYRGPELVKELVEQAQSAG